MTKSKDDQSRRKGNEPQRREPLFGREEDLSPELRKMVEGAAGEGLSKIAIEDCEWVSTSEIEHFDALPIDTKYEPEGPLRLILGAIVDAYPQPNKSRRNRIDKAEALLFGQTLSQGNNPIDDEKILRMIALKVFEKRFLERLAETDNDPPIAPIVREVVAHCKPRRRQSLDSQERRLQRKFKKHRARLLVRATKDYRWDLPDFYAKILAIIKALPELGIKTDSTEVMNRISPPDEKAAN